MFKRSLLLVSVVLSQISFGYANSDVKSIALDKDQIPRSRVIIAGRSSIVIESKNNNTDLIVGKIETLSGGRLLRTIVKDDMDNYKLSDENSNKEINANISVGLPSEFVIEKAYPNPFNPTTRIRYGVSTPSPVNIAIYDMTGRLVSDYTIGEKAPGWYEFTW